MLYPEDDFEVGEELIKDDDDGMVEDRDKYNVDDCVNIGEALHDFDESDRECDEVRDMVEYFSDKAGVKLARDLEDLEVLVEDKEDRVSKGGGGDWGSQH